MKSKFFTLPMLLILLVIQSGCVVIGYRNHFSRDLTPEQQSKVVWDATDDDLLSMENDGRIYAINGKQMQKMVQANPKAIVYKWSPHCTSEACLSLSAIQTLRDNNGIALFVVADYFHDAFSQNQVLSRPLFIADEKHYKTDVCNKLKKRFFIDLLGESTYNATKDISWYSTPISRTGSLSNTLEEPYTEFDNK